MSEKKELTPQEMSIHQDAQAMIIKARKDGVETAWDRLQEQTPHCNFCEQGLSCRNCVMGPCRTSTKGDKRKRGVCGADADVIVARNFGRFVAGGAAGHSDHGRDLIEVLDAIVEGRTTDYKIMDEEKLTRIAAEVGIETDGRAVMDIARDLVDVLFADFGSRKSEVAFLKRAPEKRRAIWQIYLRLFDINSDQSMPSDEGWTGAEIRSCCRLAALLDVPLMAAAQNVVPVSVTAAESVNRLREWANGRCLDADEAGIFTRGQVGGTGRKRRRVKRTDPSNN